MTFLFLILFFSMFPFDPLGNIRNPLVKKALSIWKGKQKVKRYQ